MHCNSVNKGLPIAYELPRVQAKLWTEHDPKIANLSQLLQLIPIDLVTLRMQVIPLARFFSISSV